VQAGTRRKACAGRSTGSGIDRVLNPSSDLRMLSCACCLAHALLCTPSLGRCGQHHRGALGATLSRAPGRTPRCSSRTRRAATTAYAGFRQCRSSGGVTREPGEKRNDSWPQENASNAKQESPSVAKLSRHPREGGVRRETCTGRRLLREYRVVTGRKSASIEAAGLKQSRSVGARLRKSVVARYRSATE
jgi:hypothetical protein